MRPLKSCERKQNDLVQSNNYKQNRKKEKERERGKQKQIIQIAGCGGKEPHDILRQAATFFCFPKTNDWMQLTNPFSREKETKQTADEKLCNDATGMMMIK